jgi:addiction module RelE/StbE family toxin
MRTLVWGKGFKRSFDRMVGRRPKLKEDLEETLDLLVENPFASQLETHKLKGELMGSWACSAGYDVRVIFQFVKGDEKEDDIFLIAVGTHDEVY